jgi:hypothetical protein
LLRQTAQKYQVAPFGNTSYNSHMPTPGFSDVQTPFRPSIGASQEAAVMLGAVFNLFDKWRLSSAQSRILLGSPAERTLQRWRAGDIAGVPHDTSYRLGCLLGIHKALRYLFTDPERGYQWIKKPNAAFAGASALDRMLQGAPTDLAAIRDFLDAERAGW